MTGRRTPRATLDIGVAPNGTAIVVTPAGVLDVSTAPKLRDALLKGVADQPSAVIVDLSRLELRQTYTLSVFTVAARRSAEWSGVPLILVAGPDVEARTGLHARAIARFLHVVPSIEAALAAAVQPPLRRLIRLRLPPDPYSARTTRRTVAATCELWGVPQVIQDAVSVASELVANAVVHARTDAVLRLELRRGLLTVAVTDEDPRLPVLGSRVGDELRAGGLGLVIVDALATTWGSTPTSAGGKLVWAVLRTDPGRTVRHSPAPAR
jgi:anti-anti-sigma regulatory factor/anti-sigma regulatory factor (Ser/Thr protein kinase)